MRSLQPDPRKKHARSSVWESESEWPPVSRQFAIWKVVRSTFVSTSDATRKEDRK
jgi:hypothetical protein